MTFNLSSDVSDDNDQYILDIIDGVITSLFWQMTNFLASPVSRDNDPYILGGFGPNYDIVNLEITKQRIL